MMSKLAGSSKLCERVHTLNGGFEEFFEGFLGIARAVERNNEGIPKFHGILKS